MLSITALEAAIAGSFRECLEILEIDLDVLHSADNVRLQIPARVPTAPRRRAESSRSVIRRPT